MTIEIHPRARNISVVSTAVDPSLFSSTEGTELKFLTDKVYLRHPETGQVAFLGEDISISVSWAQKYGITVLVSNPNWKYISDARDRYSLATPHAVQDGHLHIQEFVEGLREYAVREELYLIIETIFLMLETATLEHCYFPPDIGINAWFNEYAKYRYIIYEPSKDKWIGYDVLPSS